MSTSYITDTGRVVRKTKAPLDPGLRRKGVRLSLDDEIIIGSVTRDEADGWYYATVAVGDQNFTAARPTRGRAITAALRERGNLRR